MRVTVFDYGAGNLHSLLKALAAPGRQVVVESDPALATDTDLLVLPGVGAFPQAAARLEPTRRRVRDALLDGLPCLGICLGMQLLFERSEEGAGDGLGVIPGEVTRLRARRVPHIGWNGVAGDSEPLLEASGLELAWFANGYACRPEHPASVSAWVSHEGDRFPAIVRASRTLGVQFHPEKSSAPGVLFLGAAVDALAEVMP